MSLDSVAAEAGASKPTLYRRWATKADLATAALRFLQLSEPAPEGGSSLEALVGILENFRRSLLRPNGMSLVGTVLAEEHLTPELLARFRVRLVLPRRKMLRAVLERAREHGELRPAVDCDAVASLLVGGFYARYLAASTVSARYPAKLVRIVWEGIGRPAH